MSARYRPEPGYRYGRWAGRPKGVEESPTNCRFEVFPNERGAMHHQCSRKRGHGPSGEFCRAHAKIVTEAQS